MNGDRGRRRRAWLHVHEVTAELDGGPILGQARVAIAPDDTPDTLAAKFFRLNMHFTPPSCADCCGQCRTFAAWDVTLSFKQVFAYEGAILGLKSKNAEYL